LALVAGSPAGAADKLPSWSWTGFYIGGHLGAGWGDKWWDSTGQGPFGLPVAPQDIGQNFGTTSVDGFLGGGQIGFNYQTGRLVWGVEADASRTDMKGKFDCPAISGGIFLSPTFSTCSSKIDWIGTVVGRVGVTVDRALVYAGGGAAWAREKDHLDCTDFDCGPPFDRIFTWDGAKTSWGWTFLAGVEYAIDNHWSAKLQYNFYDFGSDTVTLASNQATGCFAGLGTGACNPFDVTTRLRTHTIKAGLNYQFNWGDRAAPQMAPISMPAVAQTWSWTGFYVGGHLGAGWGNKWWDSTGQGPFGLPVAPQDIGQNFGTTSVDGFLGGGQIGFNYQAGLLVWGVEADASRTDMEGKFPCFAIAHAAAAFSTCSSKIDWIGTIIGRLGVTVDRALVYAGGGAAWAREKDHLDCTDRDCGPPRDRIFTWDGAKTSWGWTFLAGVEYAIDNHWSAKLQYNFYDFGDSTVGLTPNQATGCSSVNGACNPFDVTTRLRTHTIKAGLNYQFNAGAPDGAPIAMPPVAQTWSWTGLYIGGHLGAGWGDKWWDSTGYDAFGSPFAAQDVGQSFGTTSVDGFLGGGQIGLNYQTGRLVWGVEADASWSNMKGAFPCPIIAGVFDFANVFSTCSSKIDLIGTIVGRLGVTVDRALVYAGGGAAWAREKDHLDCTDFDCGSPADRIFTWDGAKTSWGWTFLAGVEYAVDNHWSARLQYNFYDFGSDTVTLTPNQTTGCFGGNGCNPFDVTTQLRTHTIKLGLNYRFDWGDPFAARY
jgi:outer membrane immunogenic protein